MNYTPLETIPDVSFYQDDNLTPKQIDFVKMRTLSEGVIIRAGQNTWVDPDFVHNWQAAKSAGLKRGAYWFYDSRSDPIAQAQRFFDLVKNDPPEWGMWCDLEESYGGAWKGEANYKKFTVEVDRLYSGVVGIYTANWWWSVQSMVDNAFWAKYPLWVAQYVSSPQYVTLPKPWTSAVLWQYTSKGDGLAYGAESLNIDLNYTSQAFYDLFGGTVPPDNGGNVKYELKPAGSYNVSIRAENPDAHILGSAVGSILNGTTAQADDKYIYTADKYVNGVLRAKAGDTWYHVTSPAVGWSAELHLGVRYLNVTEIPTVTRKVTVTVEEDGWKPVSVEVTQEQA